MSGGEQLRDYLSVEEVSRHLVDFATRRLCAGVVNICSGKPISIRALVEGWILENKWDINPIYGQVFNPDYEPMEFWGDNQKLINSIDASC